MGRISLNGMTDVLANSSNQPKQFRSYRVFRLPLCANATAVNVSSLWDIFFQPSCIILLYSEYEVQYLIHVTWMLFTNTPHIFGTNIEYHVAIV